MSAAHLEWRGPVFRDMPHLSTSFDVRALRPRERETLQETVDRGNRIRVKRRECKQPEAKLKRETQFNRKVEVNGELRRCQMALAALESVETSIVRD